MITDFEIKLCDRIFDICNESSLMPDNEKQLQAMLANAYFFDGYFAGKEIDKYKVNYWPTDIYDVNLINGDCNHKLTNLSKIFQYKKNYKADIEWKPHVDLFYINKNFTEEYLLEIKFPRKSYIWKFSNKLSDSLIGGSIFNHPIFNFANSNYFTDYHEGEMYVDFIRMLNLHRINKLNSSFLYFASLFTQSETSITKQEFCNHIAEVLRAYKTTCKFMFTRGAYEKKKGKRINIWEYEPCDFTYFTQNNTGGYDLKKFDSSSPSFELLHDGKRLFSFLIKLHRTS